jgi:hypothetical protein
LPGNETTAKFLGYAGLIPFVTFSIGSWVALPYISDAVRALIAYAAIILAFMGAIHWGLAMSRASQQCSKYFITSVIPALTAWLALLLPDTLALIVLLCGFIALFAYDRAVKIPQALPDWYIPLRKQLTLVVILCLSGGLLSTVMQQV